MITMIKQTMTLAAWAAFAAAPAVVRAQTTAPPTTATPGTCDCPTGDSRGDLRNLAAFAPLGLLGALAAAGGTPGVFAGSNYTPGPTPTIAQIPPPSLSPAYRVGLPINGLDTPDSYTPETTPTGSEPSKNRFREPLRGGLIAPNTGTPLPSVFLIGTGLIAIGCVTVFRTRS